MDRLFARGTVLRRRGGRLGVKSAGADLQLRRRFAGGRKFSDSPARLVVEELDEAATGFGDGQFRRQVDGAVQCHGGSVDDLEERLDLLAFFGGNACPQQADRIEPGDFAGVIGQGERGNVLADHGDGADHRHFADADKLMDAGVAGNNGLAPDADMTAQQRAAHQGHVVGQHAVMRHVRVGHQIATISHDRGGVFDASAMDRDSLADDAVAADPARAVRAVKLVILRNVADDGMRMERTAGANFGIA